MRSIALATLVLLVSTPARAQSFFALRADLRDGRAAHGTIGHAALAIESWLDARTARVRVEDASVVIESAIDVARPGTQVVVGVGEDADLVAIARDGSQWSITMSAGTWAPLVGQRDGRAHIVLPGALPVRRATLSQRVSGASSVPARGFVAGPIDWRGWSPTALRTRVRASARGGATWTLPRGSLVRISGSAERPEESRAPYRIDVWVEGYVVHAFVDRAPPFSSGIGYGTILGTAGVCIGPPTGDLRVLPAGTTVRAGTTLAHVRADVIARVAGSEVHAMHAVRGGLAWSITGVPDVDASSLSIVETIPEHARTCTDSAFDWPE